MPRLMTNSHSRISGTHAPIVAPVACLPLTSGMLGIRETFRSKEYLTGCPFRLLSSDANFASSALSGYYRHAKIFIKETTCRFPYDGATNSTAGAHNLRECSNPTLVLNKCVRGCVPHAARWLARQPRSATSAA